MESLLRQLAGNHPPGPMPDSTTVKQETLDPSDIKPKIPTSSDKVDGLSPEEEEAAWQRAIEMMLSGEGLEALGLDSTGQPKNSTSNTDKSSAAEQKPIKEEKKPASQPNFDETIRRTMEQLKSPQGKKSSTGEAPDLAALLAQLGSDPSALDGLGEGDDELGGILDGMMAQLMTKEILEEPMAELASKVGLTTKDLINIFGTGVLMYSTRIISPLHLQERPKTISKSTPGNIRSFLPLSRPLENPTIPMRRMVKQ